MEHGCTLMLARVLELLLFLTSNVIIAFGGFGCLHPDFEAEVSAGMQLADSLTLDGHKWSVTIRHRFCKATNALLYSG
jgi:hypothetical protein